MVRYEIQVQPVRVTCNGCAPNRDYVIAYEKNNVVEFATQPQPCSGNGEVNFCRPTDPITVAPFVLSFDTGTERREVEFALYDFTNRPRSVERLITFRVPIGHQVDVKQHETFCGIRDWPFREGRMNGSLRVLLRMNPFGATPPAMGSGSSQVQQQRTSAKRAFSKDALAQLHQEGLVPANVTQLEVEEDIMAEIEAKILILKKAAKVQDKLNPKKQALWSRMAELQAEMEKLEVEVRDATSSLSPADAYVYRLLQEQDQKWSSVLPEVVDTPATTTNETTSSGGPPNPLIGELERKKAALEKKLQFLESAHAPMSDVMDALNELQHVSNVLDEVNQQGGAKQPAAGGKRSVHFKPNSDAGKSADALFDALSEGEAIDYALRVGQHMTRQMYDGVERQLEEHNKFPVPAELAFVGQSKYTTALQAAASAKPAAAAPTTAAPASAKQPPPKAGGGTKDFFDDLFAGPAPTAAATAPPPSAVNTVHHPPAPKTQSTIHNIDDLFGAPAPVVAAAPPPPPAAPQGAVQKLPIKATTEFVAFFTHRLLRVKAEALKMTTPQRTLRVAELTFQNGGSEALTLTRAQVVQEDFFSSAETEVPCHMGSPQVVIPPGEFKTLMLSFGPAVSMTDSLMVLLKVTIESASSVASVDTIRITL